MGDTPSPNAQSAASDKAATAPPKVVPNQRSQGASGSAESSPEATPAAAEKNYRASMWPRRGSLSEKLCKPVLELQAELDLPVFLFLQGDASESGPFGDLDDYLVHLIKHHRSQLPAGQEIAVLLNSPGGDARCAYGIARIFHRRCGGFTAVVPDAAMSAATLFALGAKKIVMGPDASLGPLDAQVFDIETESYGSVLNEVQALERLRAYALESVDEAMQLLVSRTGKRIDTLLPHVLRFVTDSMHPLLTKIDVVHYNERARILKVGEEYAVRLLREFHPRPTSIGQVDVAKQIASTLVEEFPEHGFWIDRDEAESIGLRIAKPTEKLDSILEELWSAIQGVTAIGMFEEIAP